MPESYMKKIIGLYNKLLSEVKKGKKEFNLYELVKITDKSLYTVRYQIVPLLLEISDCLDYDPAAKILKYTCEEAEAEEA